MSIQSLIDQWLQYVQDNWASIIIKIFSSVAIFWVLYLITKFIIRKIKKKIEDDSLESTEYTVKVEELVGNIIFVSMMIVNVLIVFAFWWFDVALILWWVSIAVGFAMENTIKNLISGIFIMWNKKIKLWDFVEIHWAFNTRWTIEEVNVRNTVVRLLDQRRVLIPNWDLVETAIQTVKSEPLIKSEIIVRVPRYVNTEQVQSLLINIINSHPNVINKEYTSNIISGFDQQWIVVKTFYYFSPQMWKMTFVIESELRVAIWKTFKQYWIKAPYVHAVIDVENWYENKN